MEANKAAKLLQHRREMLSAAAWTEGVVDALEREEFALTRIRKHNRFVWFLWASPPAGVQAGFGLAPELLLVLVDQSVQAADLNAASEEVMHSELRLDGNLMVVCDTDTRPLQDRLDCIGGHGQRIAWTAEGREWPSLTERLRNVLPTFDAYEERDPVRGAALVGRTAEISDLRTRLVRGDAVGLFGLRKMGKTSVLRAVTDSFDPASGMKSERIELPDGSNVAIVLDAGVLIERTVDALADELLRELDRRMRVAGEPTPKRRGRGLVAWKSAVEALIDEGRRVCIAIDEYDLLFEGEGGEGTIPKLNQLFRLARGWSQMNQGRVSLVLVGRDSTFLAAPEIDGVTSSLLLWCTPMWIGPLADEKATELLRKLGRRVGLTVGHESSRIAFDWTKGHPLLQRQFGSVLRATVRAKDPSWKARTDPFAHAAIEGFRERSTVQEVLREVVALLRKRHREADGLLRELARGTPWEAALSNFGGADGEAARTLKNFGIVSEDHTLPELYRWYLSHLAPPATLQRAG